MEQSRPKYEIQPEFIAASGIEAANILLWWLSSDNLSI